MQDNIPGSASRLAAAAMLCAALALPTAATADPAAASPSSDAAVYETCAAAAGSNVAATASRERAVQLCTSSFEHYGAKIDKRVDSGPRLCSDYLDAGRSVARVAELAGRADPSSTELLRGLAGKLLSSVAEECPNETRLRAAAKAELVKLKLD